MDVEGATRGDLIRLFVLNEICDDFEHVDHIIFPRVRDYASKCGLTVERDEVIDALGGLVREGLAKACELFARAGTPFDGELPGMPPASALQPDSCVYFSITPAGMGIRQSDDWWSFEDDDGFRPDWTTALDSYERP